mmetsp:Transcript_44988/g.90798  ORF Transcript_44988/g.90798 Transcript_44988/m.90798 type:complete len:211 (+) Transcript_44988:140-772(+)
MDDLEACQGNEHCDLQQCPPHHPRVGRLRQVPMDSLPCGGEELLVQDRLSLELELLDELADPCCVLPRDELLVAVCQRVLVPVLCNSEVEADGLRLPHRILEAEAVLALSHDLDAKLGRGLLAVPHFPRARVRDLHGNALRGAVGLVAPDQPMPVTRARLETLDGALAVRPQLEEERLAPPQKRRDQAGGERAPRHHNEGCGELSGGLPI